MFYSLRVDHCDAKGLNRKPINESVYYTTNKGERHKIESSVVCIAGLNKKAREGSDTRYFRFDFLKTLEDFGIYMDIMCSDKYPEGYEKDAKRFIKLLKEELPNHFNRNTIKRNDLIVDMVKPRYYNQGMLALWRIPRECPQVMQIALWLYDEGYNGKKSSLMNCILIAMMWPEVANGCPFHDQDHYKKHLRNIENVYYRYSAHSFLDGREFNKLLRYLDLNNQKNFCFGKFINEHFKDNTPDPEHKYYGSSSYIRYLITELNGKDFDFFDFNNYIHRSPEYFWSFVNAKV